MTARRGVLGIVLACVLASGVPANAAKCGAAATDETALRETYAAIDAGCPCAESANRGTYTRCGSAIVKSRQLAGLLPRACQKLARQRVTKSTCGRIGAEVCCRTSARGRVSGKVVTDASRCVAPGGGAACIASPTNVVEGCTADGCVGCGDGVVQWPETCEPPGVGHCTASCEQTPCDAAPTGETSVACLVRSDTELAIARGGNAHLVAWIDDGGQPDDLVVEARRIDESGAPLEHLSLLLSPPLDADDFIGTRSGPSLAGDAAGWHAAWLFTPISSEFPTGRLTQIRSSRIAPGGMVDGQQILESAVIVGMCGQREVGTPTGVVIDGGVEAVGWSRRVDCAGGASQLNFEGTGGAGVLPFPLVVSLENAFRAVDRAGSLASDGTKFVTTAIRHVVSTHDASITVYSTVAHVGRLSTVPWETSRPTATAYGDGSFLVAWAQPGAMGTTDTEIHATRFMPDVPPIDPDGGILVASATMVASKPAIAFDGAKWLVVWVAETSPGVYDLLGVAVRPNGNVVDATPRVLATGVAPIAPALTSNAPGWMVAFARSGGAGLLSVNVRPIAP